jgi:hypothetical protein
MVRPSTFGHPDLIRPREARIVPARPAPGHRHAAGPARRVARTRQIGERWLELAAPLGLSLLITAGFAAALCLYAHLDFSSPHLVHACGGLFLWAWALFSCSTSSRS